MHSPSGALLRVLQRFVITTSGGSLRPFWMAAYRGVAGLVARGVAGLEAGAGVYARSGTAGPDVVPGLSDIDLAVVLPVTSTPATNRERVHRRFAALGRVPVIGRLVEIPCVYEESELRDLADASYATFGLADATRTRAAYGPDTGLLDRRRLLERPGLYDGIRDWTLLAGPDRRPRVPERRDPRLVAAWLELAFWWRSAFAACLDPSQPHTAFLCAKLVAEPARIWLWLEHGERCTSRRDVLERARERLPEETEAIELALRLNGELHRMPEPPLSAVLPALARFSSRIARLVDEGASVDGADAVELLGSSDADLLMARSLGDGEAHSRAHPPGAMPLCDWRALAVPTHADESFTPVAGKMSDPRDVARAARETGNGTYRVLACPSALVFPIPALERPLPRNIACAASDPVSFALLSGQTAARFPRLPGWSIEDVASRALAEQRAGFDRSARRPASLATLCILLCAARAALLHDSLCDRARLPLTLTATAAALADRQPAARAVAEEVVGALRDGAPPARATVQALRDLVSRLPGYAT